MAPLSPGGSSRQGPPVPQPLRRDRNHTPPGLFSHYSRHWESSLHFRDVGMQMSDILSLKLLSSSEGTIKRKPEKHVHHLLSNQRRWRKRTRGEKQACGGRKVIHGHCAPPGSLLDPRLSSLSHQECGLHMMYLPGPLVPRARVGPLAAPSLSYSSMGWLRPLLCPHRSPASPSAHSCLLHSQGVLFPRDLPRKSVLRSLALSLFPENLT